MHDTPTGELAWRKALKWRKLDLHHSWVASSHSLLQLAPTRGKQKFQYKVGEIFNKKWANAKAQVWQTSSEASGLHPSSSHML